LDHAAVGQIKATVCTCGKGLDRKKLGGQVFSRFGFQQTNNFEQEI